jgi:hypothetical protein
MSDQKHEYPDLMGESLSNQNFPQSPQEYIRSLPGNILMFRYAGPYN